MSLSALPDDTLASISFWLNGFDNCSLWMASDSKLKQRLVNNVITDFWIKYTIPGRFLWPGNFLKKLSKLSRLSLVVTFDVTYIPIENIELFPIDTLKCLMLEFPDLNRVFEKSSSISSSHFMDSTTSSTNKYINLNDIYPNLEHLELNLCTSVHLAIDFFDCLPKKLKSFLVHENYFQSDAQNPAEIINMKIASLPHTLTEIDIGFYGEQTLDLSSFPPNLTRLATNSFMDVSSYERMPKYIENLEIDLGLSRAASKKEKTLSIIPSAIRKLSVSVNDEMKNSRQLFESLENLEHLSLYNSTYSLEKVMTKCPPKLKKFWSSRSQDIPSGFFNGNHLTELDLSDMNSFSRDYLTSLPQSLTSLRISFKNIQNQGITFFKLLPKNLKSFESNYYITENISSLPASLTHLSLTPKDSDPDQSFFDQLPPKLEEFNCTANVPQSILKKLPETLKLLDLWCEVVVDDDVIRLLPRGLTTLLLDVQDRITDASGPNFPPNLYKLHLIKNRTLTDYGVVFLPKSLRFLNLRNNPNLTDLCIKHLPPKLIELHSLKATQITSNSRKDLPKYLKSLNIPLCSRWRVEAVRDLPPYLIEMDLGNKAANEAWVELSEQREKQVTNYLQVSSLW